jgi:predicted nucleic acid-binding protein
MAGVVLETNILVASPLLDSREWSSLTDHAADWGIEVVVPDVVLMETVNVVRRAWTSMRQKVDDLALGVFGLEEAKAAILMEVDKRSATYEKWLRSRLDEMGVQISPTPPVDHLEIARRASEGRAPYGGKDKDGYRDTLVWYSVLAAAQEYPNAEVWFVSDNHTDFGPKPPNWTGEGTGQRESCPILFHTDLIAELTDCDLDRRVFYVVSLARIEQHFASQFAPIDAGELQQLIDTVDKNVLAQKLVDAVAGFKLDPEEAALWLEVEAAEIIGAREQADGWTFTEAARRGDAGWTARFAVDTEVDIALVGTGLVASEHTNVLRLLGQVWVSSNGQILDIAVDSAEALPDDRMRDRWRRRAARSPLGDGELSNILQLLKVQQ